MFVAWNRQRSWILLWKRFERLEHFVRALRTALRPRIRPLRVVQAAGKPSHQSAQAAHAQKLNAPQTPRRNARGADTSAATRGVRDWRQDEEETRQNTTAPSRRKRRFRVRKESSSSVPVARRGWPWCTRRHRPLALAKLASGGSVLPCSVLSLPCAVSSRFF